MCGRYALIPNTSAWTKLGQDLGPDMDAVLQQLREYRERFNVAPSETMPIVVFDQSTGKPALLEARWGFVPRWWKQPKPPSKTFNAVSETATTKPMWRHAWRHSRCLVPASLWYEWVTNERGEKLPFAFLPSGPGEEMMFAGLWDTWHDAVVGEDIATFAILTRESEGVVADVHHRMPLLLAPQIWGSWIYPGLNSPRDIDNELARNRLTDLRTYRVKQLTNNSRYKGRDTIEPVGEDEQ